METLLSRARIQETPAKDLIFPWLPWAILLLCSYIPTRFFLYSLYPRKAVSQVVESRPKEKPVGVEQRPGKLYAPRDHNRDF